jgi:hypothetical protein
VSEITDFGTFENYLRPRAHQIFARAEAHSKTLIEQARASIDAYLRAESIDAATICIACVGSVGRREALESSDLDLIPILATKEALQLFRPHDSKIREVVRERLRVPISKGEDLTKAVALQDLVDPETIGGSRDDSGSLTKRVLILTESSQVAGELRLTEVRRAILDCYSNPERTSGRHVLSLCNDIARYYRTLCIEYKAKVDVEDKDWCTRNMKLRHSRKIWYFSNIISISHLADDNPIQRDTFADALCSLLDRPPCVRLLQALANSHPIEVGNLLEHLSYFIDFMSRKENRAALAKVTHEDRYNASLGNPFPAVKFNSDALHNCMMSILNGLDPPRRKVVLDWFLL